ncbi:MAG: methyltransferase, partial [Candidatus Parabeggiatoa sp.]|nr:methyltransferase [Candidatus Parabeggiatoa sp.]
MKSTSQTPITYDPEKYADYQSVESGTILNVEFSHIGTNLLLETHQAVWSPTPFAINMGELIASDGCHDKVVMDFASGSGFLSVIAGKSGATQVIATDLNPQAIMMTQRNWALNNLNPEQLYAVESDCFDAIQGHPEIEGQVDVIYSNPPTVPDLEGDIEKLSAGDWNINGKGGRIVNDALITQGRFFLKPGGEVLFITNSKQGTKLTCELLEQYWGNGVKADGDDPLDYCIDWADRGDANWAVVRRVELLLSDYYLPFLHQIKQFAKEHGQADPFIEKEGALYQKN